MSDKICIKHLKFETSNRHIKSYFQIRITFLSLCSSIHLLFIFCQLYFEQKILYKNVAQLSSCRKMRSKTPLRSGDLIIKCVKSIFTYMRERRAILFYENPVYFRAKGQTSRRNTRSEKHTWSYLP